MDDTPITKGVPYVFTVFTPTYNRAHLLRRVYDSLRGQTSAGTKFIGCWPYPARKRDAISAGA